MTDAQAPAFREAYIDLSAITANVAALSAHAGTPHVMAVVKANGYGHGAVPAARAAIAGGADWLGVADLAEALALRGAGIGAPILAWLHAPDADFAPAIAADVSIGVSATGQLEAAASAARRSGAPARVHLKLDTGLSRNGLPREAWADAFDRARELVDQDLLVVEGIFSHLSGASPEADAAQRELFDEALAIAADRGLHPELRHLAATGATLTQPDSRYTLVRLGIGIYGLSPFSDALSPIPLRPAMTLRGRVANVRRVSAGTGASYDHTWRAERETTLALVPLGYADGIPRQASGRASVWIGGRIRPVAGRIAMDQFLVDVGDDAVAIGDPVVVFGDPEAGVPSADDWARAADTINYEIVTRIGERVQRSYGD